MSIVTAVQRRGWIAVGMAAMMIGCGSGPRAAPDTPVTRQGLGPDLRAGDNQRVPISAELPRIPRSLPLIKLARQPPPVEYVTELMQKLAPQTGLERLADLPLYERSNSLAGLSGFVQEQRLLAWLDENSGDAQVYPQLTGLTPIASSDAAVAKASAQAAFDRMLARDVFTHYAVVGPRALAGAETKDASKTGDPQDYLYYFAAQRFVKNGTAKIPVYGSGSSASIAVGAGGVIHGLNRKWRVATDVERTSIPARIGNRRALEQRIHEEFSRFKQNTQLEINDVKLVYVDGEGEYLQPAFRVVARLSPREPAPDGFERPDTLLTKYIAFGDLVEPLPILTPARPAPDPVGPGPRPVPTFPLDRPHASAAPRSALSVPSLRVGRYVASGVVSTFLESAEAFWRVLNDGGSRFLSGEFTSATTTAMFLRDRDAHVGANDLVLIEAHGAPGLVFTAGYGERGEWVQMKTLSPQLNGSASDWIIHSCRVVASAVDDATWANHWWTVMNDVRAVVGYRTDVVIADGATPAYAARLKLFAPIVSSWITELSALPEYLDTRTASGDLPAGRASAVVVCSSKDDSLAQRIPGGPPTCLMNYYVRN